MLEKEFQYYLDNQSELVEKYNDKFIVIKDQEVIGVYDSEIKAYSESAKNHELGSFLIQEVQPGKDNLTQTFRSRAIFAQ